MKLTAVTCSEERRGDQEENPAEAADVTARPWMQEWPRHQRRVPAQGKMLGQFSGEDAAPSRSSETVEITPETRRPRRGFTPTVAASGGTLSGQMSGCLWFGALCSGGTTVIYGAPEGAPLP